MSASETTWSGTYIVDEDIEITGNVTLGGDVDLIILDGKTLSLSSDKNIVYLGTEGYKLNIYSQSNGDGAGTLSVSTTSEDKYPIYDNGTLNIHSGIINATASGDFNQGIFAKNMNVYGGSVTAKGTLQGIMIDKNLSVYGGVVKGTGTVLSTGSAGVGLYVNALLTINKGEVTCIGGSADSGNNPGGNGIIANQITFKDGTITGTGGCGYGNGMGGYGIWAGNVGENTISGGTITATGGDGGTGASAGGGTGLVSMKKLVVSGGTVKATGADGTSYCGNGIYVNADLEYKGGDIEANGGTSGAYGIYVEAGSYVTNKSGASIIVGRRANSTGAWSTENVANDGNFSNFDRYMAFPMTIM